MLLLLQAQKALQDHSMFIPLRWLDEDKVGGIGVTRGLMLEFNMTIITIMHAMKGTTGQCRRSVRKVRPMYYIDHQFTNLILCITA
jgi:hypothetical protein